MNKSNLFLLLYIFSFFYIVNAWSSEGSNNKSLKGLKGVRVNLEFQAQLDMKSKSIPGVDEVALKSYIEKTVRKAGLLSEKSTSQLKVTITVFGFSEKEYLYSGRIELIEAGKLLRNSDIIIYGAKSWEVSTLEPGPKHAAMALSKQAFMNCFDTFENDYLKDNPKTK